MTTVAEIVESAFRESGMIDALANPTPAQGREALKRLNVIVSSAYGNEVGDPLFDWPIGVDDMVQIPGWSSAQWKYPVINARLIAQTAEAQTLYLPPDPPPGARISVIDPGSRLAAAPFTLDGNGRTIEGAATVTLNVNATNKTWFYRDDLGNWALLSTLASGDTFPFPEEFDDYFITKLAMRLNPRYGRSVRDETALSLDNALLRLRARYEQPTVIPADLGVLALTSRPGRRVGPSYGDNPMGGYPGIVRGRMGWY